MRKRGFKIDFRQSRSGYTLIELAVVMVVAGLMVASFASAYNLYLKTQQEKLTDDNISAVTQAMSTYLVAFGAYPCPARANAKRTDVDYGIATQCDPTQTTENGTNPTYPLTLKYPCSNNSPGAGSVGCANTTQATLIGAAAETCDNGLCWQTSDRKVQTTAENSNIIAGGGGAALGSPGSSVTIKVADGPGGSTNNYAVTLPPLSPLVRRGMVPFRTLGISEDQAYDGYKMRLEYAVTEALAVPGTYTEFGGAIDILDPIGVTWFRAGKPLAGISTAQAYGLHVLYKPPGMPAKDALGNYKTDLKGNSVLIPTDGGGAHYIIYSAGMDRIGSYTREGKQITACPAAATPAGLDSQNCTTSTKTGIYVAAPMSNGHNPDPATPTPTQCSYKDGTGACVTIADTHFDDHVKYFSETETPLWKVSSATLVGQDIQDLVNAGGSGNGKIGIGGPPGTSVADAIQISGDVHSSTKIVASSGLRDRTNTSGNNVVLPLTSTCPSNKYATSLSNGSVVPGCTASAGTQATCPAGQVAIGFHGSTLVCSQNVFCGSRLINLCQTPTIPVSDNRWLPAAMDGTIIDTRNLSGGPAGTPAIPGAVSGSSRYDVWKCNGGTWGRTSSTGVCNCTTVTNAPQTQTCYSYYGQSNPLTYNNNVTWTSSTVCPAGTTTTTPKDHSACVCNNLTIPVVGLPTPCDYGYTGGPTITTTTSTFTCSNPGGDGPGTWSGSSNTTGPACNCDPTTPPQTTVTSCPYGYSPTAGNTGIPQHNDWVCAANVGSYAGWQPAITNPPDPTYCTCTGGTDYNPSVPCGPGQTGTKSQQRIFDCTKSPPDWGDWTDVDTSQCGTITSIWKPSGTADKSSYSTPLSNQAYQSCSPNGATGDCSVANGSSYTYFLNNGCSCE